MKAISQNSDFELNYKEFPKRPKIEDYLNFNNYDETDVLDARGRLIDDMEKYSDCIEGKLKATAKICDIQERQINELGKKVILYENTREMPAYIRDQERQIKELKEEVTELTNRYIKEVENGSHSREKLADLRLSMEPTETIIRGFANLFDGYVKNQHVEQQTKELKERLHNAEKTLIVIDSLHNDSERTSELVHEYFISTDKQALKK